VLTLAARRRPVMVWLGATTAFALLNALAVVLGAGVGALVPRDVLLWIAVGLFAVFGLSSLWGGEEEEEQEAELETRRGGFASAFGVILVAELGDKTQLAVATLAAGSEPLATWTGATVALALTSLIAAFAGREVAKRLSTRWVRRLAAVAFFGAAGFLAWQAASGG